MCDVDITHLVSSPDRTPSVREKGLVTIARFPVCADSAICAFIM